MEAVPKGKELDYRSPAAQAVQYCNRLFDCERQSRKKGHTFEQRKEYSLQKEKPIMDVFWKRVSEQTPKKGTRLEKAVNYAQNHKEKFLTYPEDGRCSFSNNLSENSIRPFIVGRKNWLFSDSPKGAEASAVVYTMVEMARAHGFNIYKYLKYLCKGTARFFVTVFLISGYEISRQFCRLLDVNFHVISSIKKPQRRGSPVVPVNPSMLKMLRFHAVSLHFRQIV